MAEMATCPSRKVKPAVASMPHISIGTPGRDGSLVPLGLGRLRLPLRRQQVVFPHQPQLARLRGAHLAHTQPFRTQRGARRASGKDSLTGRQRRGPAANRSSGPQQRRGPANLQDRKRRKPDLAGRLRLLLRGREGEVRAAQGLRWTWDAAQLPRPPEPPRTPPAPPTLPPAAPPPRLPALPAPGAGAEGAATETGALGV
jgi:hypothetical protein